MSSKDWEKQYFKNEWNLRLSAADQVYDFQNGLFDQLLVWVTGGLWMIPDWFKVSLGDPLGHFGSIIQNLFISHLSS